MEEFNVGQSTIFDIKKQSKDLKQYLADSESIKGCEKRKTLKKPVLKQLDEALYKWFTGKISKGKPISGLMITEKAKQFYEDLNIAAEIKFSDSWLQNFKIRHGIRVLDVSGEKNLADHDAAKGYSDIFSRLVQKHDLKPCQIYNTNETSLYWHCIPTLLCANASGDHHCKLFDDRRWCTEWLQQDSDLPGV